VRVGRRRERGVDGGEFRSAEGGRSGSGCREWRGRGTAEADGGGDGSAGDDRKQGIAEEGRKRRRKEGERMGSGASAGGGGGGRRSEARERAGRRGVVWG